MLGGDSDTIACMAGGIAEAFYDGVPADWREKAAAVLRDGKCEPDDFEMVMEFHKYAAPIIGGWEKELPEGIL